MKLSHIPISILSWENSLWCSSFVWKHSAFVLLSPELMICRIGISFCLNDQASTAWIHFLRENLMRWQQNGNVLSYHLSHYNLLPQKCLSLIKPFLYEFQNQNWKMITCKFLKKQNFQFSKLVISDYPAQQKTKLFSLLEADHLLGPRCPKALPFSVFLDLKAGILPTRCFASFEEKNVFFSPVLQLFHSRRFIFICQPFSF